MQPELVKSFGYPIEEHQVTTEDGYILALHRIHVKQACCNKTSRVVLLGHPLMSSSAVFTFGPANQSLAYILADEGITQRNRIPDSYVS